MNDVSQAGIRRSIAGRLLFWFLVIALIPCAILTAITARIATSALERAVRDTLVQTAAGKAGELEAYAAERVRDGAALARGPSIVQAVRDLAAVPAGSPARPRTALCWSKRMRRSSPAESFCAPSFSSPARR